MMVVNQMRPSRTYELETLYLYGTRDDGAYNLSSQPSSHWALHSSGPKTNPQAEVCVVVLHFILFYFILFYFILFYFILFFLSIN
jgi:hypothetical protein